MSNFFTSQDFSGKLLNLAFGPTSATRPNLCLAIHDNDQMLNHSLLQHRDNGWAYSQYYGVSLQQFSAALQILKMLFGENMREMNVLDFACGYGRLLRFLTLIAPPSHIWAAELQPEAVNFVAQQFGVNGVISNIDPREFDPGRTFDFIWVASLFSHLPEELFRAWLARLISLLSPRGILCFSVRDESQAAPGAVIPELGVLFHPESENAQLDRTIYGTTYASEKFVAGVLRDVLGVGHTHTRLPKALAHEQDLYVVARDPARSLTALQGFRRGPWGWLDRKQLQSDGKIYLEGWAASLDDGPIDHVEISLGDRQFRCDTHKRRDDVCEVFKDPRMLNSGWEFRHDFGEPMTDIAAEIAAVSVRGERALIYAGPIGASQTQ